jgi:Macrocin-O-methyltransferase (TylF)
MQQTKRYSMLRRPIVALLRHLGYELVRSGVQLDGLYDQDGLTSRHNHEFMNDPGFRNAYQRGLVAAQGVDPKHHWRVHTALWAAGVAIKTRGDFIECGVNAGFISSAIMHAYDWNSAGRKYFLVDSFTGPPMNQFSEKETDSGILAMVEDAVKRGAYVTDMDRVRSNFSEWPNAQIVKGTVPDVLSEISIPSIAFLHLDLNAARPESAALEYFWSRISNNGVVLLDDYAYMGYEAQKAAIDELGEKIGFSTLSLPTGQGLIVKGSKGPEQDQEYS